MDWKLLLRINAGKAELVRAPIDQAKGPVTLLQTFRGRALPKEKKASGGKQGILSDATGSRALQAFRLAVKEAKKG